MATQVEQQQQPQPEQLKAPDATEQHAHAQAQPGRLARARSKAASQLTMSANRLSLSQTRSTTATPAVEKNIHEFSGVFPKPAAGCKPDAPRELTPVQEAAYDSMLSYFKARSEYPVALQPGTRAPEPLTQWEKLRLLSRESLLRYLRASRWDVHAAQKRLVDTIAWRREFGVDSLDPNEMELEAKSGKETVLGFDKRARPLHYMHPHRNDTKETPRQMQFAVWILERCIDLMPPGTEQLALLINFDHRSRNPTSIANAKLMLWILQNHYVERLGIALCINVPWIFKAFFNAISSFIDPVTRNKCKFDEAIKDEVPAEQLSAEFGGALDPQYQHDRYWPDLVKTCDERRAAMLSRFESQCNGEIGASEWLIKGGDESSSSTSAAAVTAPTPDEAAPGLGPDDARKQSLERFSTPSETLNGNPIDRIFPSSAGVPSRTQTPKPLETLETTHEEDASRLSPTPSHIATDGAPSRTATLVASSSTAAPTRAQTHAEPAAHAEKVAAQKAANRKSGFFASLKRHGKSGKGGKPDLHGIVADVSGAAAAGAEGAAKKLSKVAKKHEEKSNDAPQAQAAQHAALATDKSSVAASEEKHAGEAPLLGSSTDEAPAQDTAAPSVAAPSSPSASSASIRVLLFASAKEASGLGSLHLALPPSGLLTLPALAEELISRARDPAGLRRVLDGARWSVAEEMVDPEDVEKTALKGGEEVAVIPPVSGG